MTEREIKLATSVSPSGTEQEHCELNGEKRHRNCRSRVRNMELSNVVIQKLPKLFLSIHPRLPRALCPADPNNSTTRHWAFSSARTRITQIVSRRQPRHRMHSTAARLIDDLLFWVFRACCSKIAANRTVPSQLDLPSSPCLIRCSGQDGSPRARL